MSAGGSRASPWAPGYGEEGGDAPPPAMRPFQRARTLMPRRLVGDGARAPSTTNSLELRLPRRGPPFWCSSHRKRADPWQSLGSRSSGALGTPFQETGHMHQRSAGSRHGIACIFGRITPACSPRGFPAPPAGPAACSSTRPVAELLNEEIRLGTRHLGVQPSLETSPLAHLEVRSSAGYEASSRERIVRDHHRSVRVQSTLATSG